MFRNWEKGRGEGGRGQVSAPLHTGSQAAPWEETLHWSFLLDPGRKWHSHKDTLEDKELKIPSPRLLLIHRFFIVNHLRHFCLFCFFLIQGDENDPDQQSDSEESSTKGETQVQNEWRSRERDQSTNPLDKSTSSYLWFVHISSDTSILLSRRVGSLDHSSLTSLPAGDMISSFLSLPSPSSVLFHFLWLPSSAHCLHVWVDTVNAGKKSWLCRGSLAFQNIQEQENQGHRGRQNVNVTCIEQDGRFTDIKTVSRPVSLNIIAGLELPVWSGSSQ